MSGAFAELRTAGVSVLRACLLIGRARATHYRHTRRPVHGPRQARVVPDNGQALSQHERAAVLTLINTPAYADLSIGTTTQVPPAGHLGADASLAARNVRVTVVNCGFRLRRLGVPNVGVFV